MEKIWNALRYGDRETRKCIGGVIAFSVVAVVLIVVSALFGQFGIFIMGMLSAVVAIILSQTFTLVDDDFVAEVDEDGTKETVRSFSVRKTGQSATSRQLAKGDSGKGADGENADRAGGDRRGAADRMDARREELREQEQDYSQYDQVVLKKIKKKYHVRRDHRPIIVDYSKSYRIKECPAFIWRTHNKVHLLLLEKEPRRISISRDLIRHLEYEPSVRADRSREYRAFREPNLVTSVFGEFLPDYFDSKTRKTQLKYKNLYRIYPDIQISNRSAATVMDLLLLNFMPDDKITQSDKLNGYFKRVYAAHILYQDKVYSIIEYKDSVEQTLKEMCYAEMPEREFHVTLENLVKGRMISQEYADHYIERKRKLDTKMVSVKRKSQ